MPAVHIDLRQPTPGGGDAPAGAVSWVPTQRRNVTTYIVLPEPFSVDLVAGAATVTVAANGAEWCWQVDEPDGTRRYVAVPGSGVTLEYNALTDVDPDTLAPSASPAAAWTVAQNALANRVDALEAGGIGTITIPELPAAVPIDVWQASGGTWPASTAAAGQRTNWIGYPGLTSLPATTGRPAAVAGVDSYELRT